MIEPENYEYLWTDHEVDFIFTSCYLFPEFKEHDFLLIYNHKEKGLKFFLSKKSHQRLSEKGLKFYREDYDEWKERIENSIEKGKKLVRETETAESLNNEQIKEKIMERVKLFQKLGGDYFHTEFFFTDKAEKSDDTKIKSRLKEMSEIKYKARKVLNDFYNYEKVFRPYIKEVANRKERDDLRWLSHKKIIDVINGKDVQESDRGEKDWILGKKTDWALREEKDVIEAFNNHFFENKSEEVEGTTANKGIYRGTAKVLRTIFSDKIKEEMKKVDNGDVLIANTTGPEVMAACQRAGAIVTDEGGLTSHAAIVSRELGIPCIVGTGAASQIFKDGDKIEVDANNGKVKKL